MAGLHEDKMKSFLEKYPEFADILSELFQKTVYYTTKEVTDGIRKLVSRYIKERDTESLLYVNMSTSTSTSTSNGSEKWIYESVKDLLPPHEILPKNPVLPQDKGIDIIFMDDWILSGANACSQLEDALWKKSKVMPQVTYTVLTFISTKEAHEELSRLSNSYKKIDIKFMSEITVELFEPKSTGKRAFIKEFLPDVDRCPYPVHLEYKIANQFGSFPTIYSHCRDVIVKPY